MDEEQFWSLIDQTRKDNNNCNIVCNRMTALLAELPLEDIFLWDGLYASFHRRAYRWNLWGAAYLMNGGCSDDGFFYFRAWLIMQGQQVYKKALEDPDMLADLEVKEGAASCEEFGYVAFEAYKLKTGLEDYNEEYARRFPPTSYREPEGEGWEEDDLGKLFPRLYEKYEWEE